MEKTKDSMSQTELFDSLVDAVASNSYFVAEYIDDWKRRLVINERKLNILNIELMKELLAAKWIMMKVDDMFVKDFIFHLIINADSCQAPYQHLKKLYDGDLNIAEKIVAIDAGIWGSGNRSALLAGAISRIGLHEAIKTTDEQFYAILEKRN